METKTQVIMSSVVEMSVGCGFNGFIYISDALNRSMVNMVQEVVRDAVETCAIHYKFDAEEAVRMLNLIEMKVKRTNKAEKKSVKVTKEKAVKASFPLPFNGEFNELCCNGLRQNNGLYTQCQGMRKGDKEFCKGCQQQAEKNEHGKPDYGTIQDRLEAGIMEFKDPSGKSPTPYTKVMKKYKMSKEQVLEEAGKFNITVNELHFDVAESKRGRPKAVKEAKAPKGVKGRPKKSKKVIEIEGESDDLFASLIANASEESEDEEETVILKTKSDKEAKKKAEKEAKLATAKAEKESKLAAAKAEKEAKLAAAKAEKEAKLAAEKAEKEAKKKAEEEEKEAKKAAKESKKEKKAKKTEESDDEVDTVKKIEYNGKKYLKSKKTGIIYNMDQDVIGKWNEKTNKIDFDECEEEEEDEYDE